MFNRNQVSRLSHPLGSVAGNVEQGVCIIYEYFTWECSYPLSRLIPQAGAAAANADNNVQSVVSELQSNKSLAGDVNYTVAGGRRSLRSVTTSIKGVKKWWKKL